jgi:hypothetical protein
MKTNQKMLLTLTAVLQLRGPHTALAYSSCPGIAFDFAI